MVEMLVVVLVGVGGLVVELIVVKFGRGGDVEVVSKGREVAGVEEDE